MSFFKLMRASVFAGMSLTSSLALGVFEPITSLDEVNTRVGALIKQGIAREKIGVIFDFHGVIVKEEAHQPKLTLKPEAENLITQLKMQNIPYVCATAWNEFNDVIRDGLNGQNGRLPSLFKESFEIKEGKVDMGKFDLGKNNDVPLEGYQNGKFVALRYEGNPWFRQKAFALEKVYGNQSFDYVFAVDDSSYNLQLIEKDFEKTIHNNGLTKLNTLWLVEDSFATDPFYQYKLNPSIQGEVESIEKQKDGKIRVKGWASEKGKKDPLQGVSFSYMGVRLGKCDVEKTRFEGLIEAYDSAEYGEFNPQNLQVFGFRDVKGTWNIRASNFLKRAQLKPPPKVEQLKPPPKAGQPKPAPKENPAPAPVKQVDPKATQPKPAPQANPAPKPAKKADPKPTQPKPAPRENPAPTPVKKADPKATQPKPTQPKPAPKENPVPTPVKQADPKATQPKPAPKENPVPTPAKQADPKATQPKPAPQVSPVSTPAKQADPKATQPKPAPQVSPVPTPVKQADPKVTQPKPTQPKPAPKENPVPTPVKQVGPKTTQTKPAPEVKQTAKA